MRSKPPKNTEKISWTKHAIEKMRYYQLSESRLKRVLNNPERKELGIAPGTIAIMQPASRQGGPTGSKKYSTEIWLMYQPVRQAQGKNFKEGRIKIITAWRYPGTSPIRGPIPIPEEILKELDEINY